jgi:hypothetical protein
MVYNDTLENLSQTDTAILHSARIDEIIQRAQQNSDAYLASADAILEQEDEPG